MVPSTKAPVNLGDNGFMLKCPCYQGHLFPFPVVLKYGHFPFNGNWKKFRWKFT